MSKDTERKDPTAFNGVDAGAIRRAAQGPAGPVRGSQDADELRRKRMARFGGGAATATRP